MKSRLNQLTLSDFIELLCGNHLVLCAPSEILPKEHLNQCAIKLIGEYRAIVNPVATKAMLVEYEDITKQRIDILLLRICQTLMSLNVYDDVREILQMIDCNSLSMTEEQVKSKVEELLRMALFEQKRNDEMREEEMYSNKLTPDQIRASFDAEIAFMMTFFKMPIDYATNAAIYANIVHQADADIKHKLRSR
ncbi:hypothetical protein J8K87_16225 [Bacteroides fragilis]|uniref:hypothetical protein n=1 Tax=Bacteroides fragilis TaxID=817 RepID=UPI00202FD453|nr:hypothetical protein [Bacteroides fragilis]MCM0385731.1 hypothetical protein [Bacteroides fragilis]